jgi:nucleotide-binding universal stress UspA family protein
LAKKEKGMTKSMKVLIGYDGSSGADAALNDLRRAGFPHDVEALVLSVADVWFLPAEGEPAVSVIAQRVSAALQHAHWVAEQAMVEANRLAQNAAERVQAQFPGWTVRAEACADSPAWGIILKAEEWQADLIVLGARGLTPVGRLLLGSVSQTVVTQARCSVRIAREWSAEPKHPSRIVIGVDGSAQAQAAVRSVAGRVWPSGSEVRVIATINPSLTTAVTLPAVQPWRASEAADQYAWIREFVEAAGEQLGVAGLAVSTVIQEGDPKQMLIEEAERWNADCIFVGARGLNRMERLLLGSVSTAVAARANCSVEVTRPS